MSRQVSCPKCKAKYSLPDDGREVASRIKCKHCEAVFNVGGPAKPANVSKPSRPGRTGAAPPKSGSMSLTSILLIGCGALVALGGLVVVLLLVGYFAFIRPRATKRELTDDSGMLVKPKQPDQQSSGGTGLTGGNGPTTIPPSTPAITLPPLYTLKNPPSKPTIVTLKHGINKFGLLPDGKTAVVPVDSLIAEQRAVILVDLTTGQEIKSFPIKEVVPRAVAVLPGGKMAIVGGSDPNLVLSGKDAVYYLDLESGKVGPAIAGPKVAVVDMALSRDGTLLATLESAPRGTVRLLDLKAGREIFKQENAHTTPFDVAITPDGKYVLSSGMDGGPQGNKVTVWDAGSGQQVRSFIKFTGNVEHMAISTDGKMVAGAANSGLGGSVGVWDLATGAERLSLANRGAHRVAFGPQDKTLLVAFHDGSVRLYDLRGSSEIGGFKAFDTAPSLITLLPDGKTGVAVNYTTMKLWNLPDSLEKLAGPGGRPLVQGGNGPPNAGFNPQPDLNAPRPGGGVNPQPDPNAGLKTIGNAMVTGVQGPQLQLTTPDGKIARANLQPNTRFLDASGREVSPAQGQGFARIANIVTVTIRPGPVDTITELRLIRSGPVEWVRQRVKIKSTTLNSIMFNADGQDVTVQIVPTSKFYGVDNQEVIADKNNKFFDFRKIYNLKYRVADTGDRLILIEERELRDNPAEAPGAISVKNARLTRHVNKGKSSWTLTPPGKPPIVVFITTQTKGFDRDGKPMRAGNLMTIGRTVDAIYVPDANDRYRLLEIRDADGP